MAVQDSELARAIASLAERQAALSAELAQLVEMVGSAPAEAGPLVLSVSQVAHRLGVSRATVYRLLSSGQLGHFKVAGSTRIRPEHVEEFLTRVEVAAS
ncbi:MAG: helix-turn-helix domain-containing protein [Nocardioides sp.]